MKSRTLVELFDFSRCDRLVAVWRIDEKVGNPLKEPKVEIASSFQRLLKKIAKRDWIRSESGDWIAEL